MLKHSIQKRALRFLFFWFSWMGETTYTRSERALIVAAAQAVGRHEAPLLLQLCKQRLIVVSLVHPEWTAFVSVSPRLLAEQLWRTSSLGINRNGNSTILHTLRSGAAQLRQGLLGIYFRTRI